jgi:hypothetical protein
MVGVMAVCLYLNGPAIHGQAGGGLLDQLELRYEGAFRVPPGGTDTIDTFEYGGTALVFDTARRSLWMVGHDHYQRVAEISIPDIRITGHVDELDTAQQLTQFRDILRGRLTQIGASDAKIGGLIRDGNDWIVSAWIYYDASNLQSQSHFRVAANGTVSGPFQLGDGDRSAGFVSGYMTPVPPEWQGNLGGTALTGQCCIPIVSRTSLGPAVASFSPAHVGRRSSIPLTHVLGYPIDHPTLGNWDDDGGGLFNGNTQVGGVIFPQDTSSVIFFGRIGRGEFCYGTGTANPELHGRVVPDGGGARYCYDPAGFDQGTHGYPYSLHLWAYDAHALQAVRDGRMAPWDVRPYAAGTFTLPFERGLKSVGGATYDPATRRIFVSVLTQDGPRPLVHVLRLGELSPDGNPPPAPPSQPKPPSGLQRPTSKPPVGRAVPRN